MLASELKEKVESSDVYKEWRATRPKSVLSSIFGDLKKVPEWTLNYFNPQTGKMSSFTCEPISVKTRQEIIESDQLPKALDLDLAKAPLEDVIDNATVILTSKFSSSVVTRGICVLQIINNEQVWNVTFFTSNLKAINIRINMDGVLLNSEFFALMDVV